ncbi:MAG TPA: insulinase family protein [Candidatus Acidoferrum sp.]|nr:insulinase family protein [Candidatus Acidoferrum sp.]
MFNARKFTSIIVLLLVATALPFSAWAGYQRINSPNPADPMAVQIYRLDNGLTVYLTENHESPRFEAQIAVRAGSKNDPPETTGLAHYLEHLLFKGTMHLGTTNYALEKPHLDRITALYEQHFRETDPQKRKAIYEEINKENQLASQYEVPNEMDKLYKAMGEDGLNAHTGRESTVFEVNLPSNRLEQWAAIESERFQYPVFRLFQPELEIVYEEKNRSLDNKDEIIFDAVNKLLFKQHPYGQQTTIGEVEHLKNPSLEHVMDFYQKYYVPGNMAIAISGDIHIPDAIKLIDKYFSAWKPGPVPPPKTWLEQPIPGPERVTVKYKGEEYVLLAFRLPGQTNADIPALKVVDMVLDNATAGLINLNLNQQQQVRQAGAGPELNNDYGTEYLWGIPKKGQSLKDVEDLLLQQVALVREGQFENWIVPAIVNDFKKTRKAEMESNEGRVTLMRNAFVDCQDWDDAVGEIARLEKVTKADVVRVAGKYFGGGYVAGYRVDEQQDVPKIEKPRIDKIQIDPTRQSEFFRQVMAMKIKPIEPVWVQPGRDYQKTNVAEGVPLYYVKNPLNDLFALTISVDVGTRHDNRLETAIALLDKAGTGRFDGEALKKEWYKLGTDFSVSAGDNETTISISGLDENFAASWALLMELLQEPKADADTLTELKKIILAQREDAKKDFQTVARAVARFNRYGTNSPYLQELPNAALEKLSPAELQNLIKSLLHYQHVITYAGSLSLDRVRAIVQQPAVAGRLAEPPPYKFLKAAAPATNRVYFFNKEMAQAQVRLEFSDGEYSEASQPQVQLFNDYFAGGMSGVVFQELREARALAYQVGAVYSNGSRKGEQNLMIGAMGCQADKTPEALNVFLELFEKLPASPERFAETRDSILSRYRTGKIGFRDVIGAVRSWERLEVPIDPRPERYAQIQKLGLEDVLKFDRTHLQNRPKLISIVGDKSKIDLGKIKEEGPITELEVKDIFAF